MTLNVDPYTLEHNTAMNLISLLKTLGEDCSFFYLQKKWKQNPLSPKIKISDKMINEKRQKLMLTYFKLLTYSDAIRS